MLQNKKYQIFVSSTYEDLKDERKCVIENILSISHLAVGMELFVASDDEQFDYIKKIIDNCDYYVLIIGGRYGSIHPVTQKSYTQMEFEYALNKGLPVLVFPYENIEKLPLGKRDTDITNIKNFISLASNNRMCRFWTTKEDLALNVIKSLQKIFNEKPQRGWIRPDEYDNSELLNENINLRKEKDNLKAKISELQSSLKPQIKNLADMDEFFEIIFEFNKEGSWRNDAIIINWNDIFSYIAPCIIAPVQASNFSFMFNDSFINIYKHEQYNQAFVRDDIIQTIKIQFMAKGLIDVYTETLPNGRHCEFIKLTESGIKYLQEIKTVKTKK